MLIFHLKPDLHLQLLSFNLSDKNVVILTLKLPVWSSSKCFSLLSVFIRVSFSLIPEMMPFYFCSLAGFLKLTFIKIFASTNINLLTTD